MNGYEKRTRTLELLLTAPVRPLQIVLGKEEGERVYVRSSASPRIYQVGKLSLTSLPKTPEELEDSPAKSGAGAKEG